MYLISVHVINWAARHSHQLKIYQSAVLLIICPSKVTGF